MRPSSILMTRPISLPSSSSFMTFSFLTPEEVAIAEKCERFCTLPDGLRSADIGEEFVDDFARASSLRLFVSGQEVDSFKLAGTRGAVEAINQCYVFHMRRTAPYAGSGGIEQRSSP